MSQPNQAPSFGPYNTLMCRPDQIASFPLNASISKEGLVVATDFYPYSNGPSTQTIFSIRNTASNFISLRVDYFLPSETLNIWINPPSGSSYYITTSISIRTGNESSRSTRIMNYFLTIGNWNRLIFEIVQAQPQGLEAGFSSARVWVNQTVTTRVFFGDLAAGDTTITDGDNAALDICGVFDSTSPNLVSSSLAGYFDILNFVWFQGARGLFTSTTGSIIEI